MFAVSQSETKGNAIAFLPFRLYSALRAATSVAEKFLELGITLSTPKLIVATLAARLSILAIILTVPLFR